MLAEYFPIKTFRPEKGKDRYGFELMVVVSHFLARGLPRILFASFSGGRPIRLADIILHRDITISDQAFSNLQQFSQKRRMSLRDLLYDPNGVALTKNQIVTNLRGQHYSQDDIAEIFAISHQAVGAIEKRHGRHIGRVAIRQVEWKDDIKSMTEADILQALADLMESGKLWGKKGKLARNKILQILSIGSNSIFGNNTERWKFLASRFGFLNDKAALLIHLRFESLQDFSGWFYNLHNIQGKTIDEIARLIPGMSTMTLDRFLQAHGISRHERGRR